MLCREHATKNPCRFNLLRSNVYSPALLGYHYPTIELQDGADGQKGKAGLSLRHNPCPGLLATAGAFTDGIGVWARRTGYSSAVQALQGIFQDGAVETA